MVRNIVGTLVHVGRRARDPGWVREVLRSRDRSLAAATFGPEGLYLESVDYDPSWQLPHAARERIELPLEA
jgi:tRNA pseudouridine38-40 synthase